MKFFASPLVVVILLATAPVASAQSTQPSLQSLDREIQQLFKTTQRQTVRVTVPIHLPTALLQQEHPLAKWGQRIDPHIMQKLAVAAARGGQSGQVFIEARN